MMHIDLNLYLVLSNLIPSTILFVAPYPSAVLSQIKKLFLFKKTSSQASNMLWFGGELVKRYPFSSILLHVKTSDLFMVERHLKL